MDSSVVDLINQSNALISFTIPIANKKKFLSLCVGCGLGCHAPVCSWHPVLLSSSDVSLLSVPVCTTIYTGRSIVRLLEGYRYVRYLVLSVFGALCNLVPGTRYDSGPPVFNYRYALVADNVSSDTTMNRISGT